MYIFIHLYMISLPQAGTTSGLADDSTCIHIYTNVYIYTQMYTHINAYTYSLRVYIYIYMHIYDFAPTN